MNIERAYVYREASEIRKEIVNRYALPIIRNAFSKFTELNSAYLLFANYTDDWGVEIINDFILYSVLHTPDWIAFGKSQAQDENYLQLDPVNFPGFKESHYYITYDLYDEVEKDSNFYYYEATNESIIKAVSPFCEYSHVNSDYAEAYTLYALFTRTNKELKVEIVEKMLHLS